MNHDNDIIIHNNYTDDNHSKVLDDLQTQEERSFWSILSHDDIELLDQMKCNANEQILVFEECIRLPKFRINEELASIIHSIVLDFLYLEFVFARKYHLDWSVEQVIAYTNLAVRLIKFSFFENEIQDLDDAFRYFGDHLKILAISQSENVSPLFTISQVREIIHHWKIYFFEKYQTFINVFQVSHGDRPIQEITEQMNCQQQQPNMDDDIMEDDDHNEMMVKT